MRFLPKMVPSAASRAKNTVLNNDRGFALAAVLVSLFLIQAGIYASIKLSQSQAANQSSALVSQTKQGMAVVRDFLIQNAGDPDNDGHYELPKEAAGNAIPGSIPVNKADTWGTNYIYCTWDLGAPNSDPTYSQNNTVPPLSGLIGRLISSGPDKTAQTACSDTSAKGDDVVLDIYESAVQYSSAALGGWQAPQGQNYIQALNPAAYVGIGTTAAAPPTHRLELADATTPTGGLALGDVEVFRSAPNTIQINGGGTLTSVNEAVTIGVSDSSVGAWIRNDGANTNVSTNIGDLYLGYAGNLAKTIRIGNGALGTVQVVGSAPAGSIIVDGTGKTTLGGVLNAALGIQVAGVTVVDASRNISAVTVSASGSFNTTGGYQVGGSIVVDNARNITGNSVNSANGYQLSGVTVIDSSRDLTGIVGVATPLDPVAPNTYDLATGTGNQYRNLYAQTIYQNGQQVVDASTLTGTTSYLAKFTSGHAVGNSQIIDDGTNVSINALPQAGNKLYLKGATSDSSANALKAVNLAGSNLFTVRDDGALLVSTGSLVWAPTAARTITLPDVTGTAITTGNLTGITATGTIASGTWNGSAIGALYGGTGLDGSTAANGTFLIGNGAGFTLAGLTGTSKQVIVTNSAGGITLSLPQNVDTTATPTFAGMKITSNDTLAWAPTAARTITFPDVTGTVVTTGDTGSVTNAMLAGGIAASKLVGTDIATVGTITTGTWNGSVIGAQYGGTGIGGGYSAGDMLYASGASTLAKLSDVATGNVLISGGVGAAPAWGKVGLTTHVSGTLPYGNGGTGVSATPTNGQLLIGNGAGYTLQTLAGTANQVVVSNAAGWITLSLPQDIATTSSPSFAGMTLNGTMTYPAYGTALKMNTGNVWGRLKNLYSSQYNDLISLGVGFNRTNYNTGTVDNAGYTATDIVISGGANSFIDFNTSPSFGTIPVTAMRINNNGGVSIGSYAGTALPPANGLIVSGPGLFGTSVSDGVNLLQVNGGASIKNTLLLGLSSGSLWGTTLKSIEMGSTGNFIGGTSGGSGTYLGMGAYYNGGWKYSGGGAASLLTQGSDGSWLWQAAGGGWSVNAGISWVTQMGLGANGDLVLGTTDDGINKLQVGGNIKTTGSLLTGSKQVANGSELVSVNDLRSDSAVAVFGMFSRQAIAATTGPNAFSTYSVFGSAQVDPSNTQNLTASGGTSGIYGGYFQSFVLPGAVGTINRMIGVSGTVFNQAVGSTITNAYSIYANCQAYTGPITNATGVFIYVQEANSNAVNTSNLYIGAPTMPAGRWGIYNASAMTNYHAGRTLLGTTTDDMTNILQATGNAKITGSLGIGTSASTFLDVFGGSVYGKPTNIDAVTASVSGWGGVFPPSGSPGVGGLGIFLNQNSLGNYPRLLLGTIYGNNSGNIPGNMGLGTIDFDGYSVSDGKYLNGAYIRSFATNAWGSNVASGYLDFGTNNGAAAATSRMRIAENGHILMNTLTDAGYLLRVNGTGYFDGALTASGGSWSSSDAYFKRDVVNLNSAGNIIDRIRQLNGVYYYWRTQQFPGRNFAPSRQIGVIAQNVETVFPELVNTAQDGYKSVAYDKLPAILIEGVKAQQVQLDDHERRIQQTEADVVALRDKEIAGLRAENSSLKDKVDALEKWVASWFQAGQGGDAVPAH